MLPPETTPSERWRTSKTFLKAPAFVRMRHLIDLCASVAHRTSSSTLATPPSSASTLRRVLPTRSAEVQPSTPATALPTTRKEGVPRGVSIPQNSPLEAMPPLRARVAQERRGMSLARPLRMMALRPLPGSTWSRPRHSTQT